MHKKWKIAGLAIAASLAVTAFFQNCSNGGSGANGNDEVSAASTPAPVISSHSDAVVTSSANSITIAGTCKTSGVIHLSGTVLASEVSSGSLSQICAAGAFSFTINKTVDGIYYLHLTQEKGGVFSLDTTDFVWVRDTAAPSAPIVSAPLSNPYYSSIADASFTIQGICESLSTVTLSGDSAGSMVCTGGSYSFVVSQAATTTPDAFNFTISQTDLANNTSSTTTFQWIREDMPPTPTIASPAVSPLRNNLSILTISGTCDGSDTVYLGGSETNSATCAGSAYSFNVIASGDNTYTYSITQVNNSNQTSAAVTTQWIVDTVAPAAPTITNPDPATNPSPYVSASSTLNLAGACEVDAMVNLFKNGAATPVQTVVCPPEGEYAFSETGLADGIYDYEIMQVDLAGNESAITEFEYERDTSVPSTPTIATPIRTPFASNVDSLVISGSCMAGMKVTLSGDDTSDQICSPTYDYQFIISKTSAPSTSNTYSFTVYQTSATGIDSGLNSQTWVQDKIAPPQITISSPATASLESSGNTFYIEGDCEDGATIDLTGDATDSKLCVGSTFIFSVSKSTDATYNFSVGQTDEAGNTGPASLVQWVRNSVAPPNPVILSPAASTFHSTSTTLVVNGTCTSGDTVNFDGDLGTQTATCSGGNFSFTVDSSTDGSYYLTVSQTHADLTSGAASMIWALDRYAPNTGLTSQPSNRTWDTTAVVTFISDEIATFECKLDSGTYAACFSGASFSGLAEGRHTISVRAIDQAGNVDATPAVASFTVDLTAPTVTITAAPAAHVTTSTVSVSFNSADPDATFECQLDSDAYAGCVSGASFSGLSEGNHTISVRATDEAGNTGPTATTATFHVDTTAPVLTFTAQPASLTNSNTASFSFTADDSGTTFQCKVDSGSYSGGNSAESYSSCTSPKSYTSPLAEGSRTFSLLATNLSGLTTTATVTWVIDRTEPTTTISSAPAANISTTTASVSFTSNDAGATFECKLDSAAYAVCTSPADYTGLAEGNHTISVRAKDLAGNYDSTPATATFNVDTSAPVITISAQPSNPSSSSTGSFTFSSSDSGTTYQCKIDSGSYSSCTSPKSYTGLTDGSHTVSIQATNAVSLTSTTDVTWVIDLEPDTTITSGPGGTNLTTDSTSVSFTSNDVAATFECKIDTGSYAVCTSPASFTGMGESTRTISVRAKDAAGNYDTTPATATFTVNTVAPVVTITRTSGNNSPTFSIVSDHAGTTFQCKVDTGAYSGTNSAESFSSCTSPKSYSNVNNGSRTFTVLATNPAGGLNSTTNYNWNP